MPERVLVLPLVDEERPELFGLPVRSAEVLVTYRDVGKVTVNATETTLRRLVELSEPFVSPLSVGEPPDSPQVARHQAIVEEGNASKDAAQVEAPAAVGKDL